MKAMIALASVVLTACAFLPDNTLPPGGAPAQFIALPADFEGYRDWPSFVVEAGEGVAGHATVRRTVYVSAVVANDGAGFDVGTLLLKTGVNAARDDQIHAMVKRGGGFNSRGARGWEWFEFTVNDDGALVQDWRGEDAPDGECYGVLPGQPCDSSLSSCNACHAGSVGNDYVQSAALQLRSIDESLLK